MSLRFGMPLAVAALALAAGSAQAVIVLGNGAAVSLSDVLASNDRTFQVGDKLFTVQSYTSTTVPASAVTLVGYIALNPLDGIGFDIRGNFSDTPGDNDITDLNIHYTVQITPDAFDAGFRIKDVGLLFDGQAAGMGSFARVDELIFDPAGIPGLNLIGALQAFANAGPPPQSQLQDFADLPNPTVGYRQLEINKDIQFYAIGTSGQASATFVRQTFSQIPTPGGLVLMGTAGLLLLRRRR